MKNKVFEFLDKMYGSEIRLIRVLDSLRHVFLDENNEKILVYESLGEDGTIVVIQKMLNYLINFFPISNKEAEKFILEWFILRYGNEKNNTIKKIVEYYKSETIIGYTLPPTVII